jgi:hypothetical protein
MVYTFLLVGCLVGFSSEKLATEQPESPPIQTFVTWLLDGEGQFQSVSFAEVVYAVSGAKVLPVDLADPVDAAMLELVKTSLDEVLLELAVSDNPIHQVGRVNEISRHVEDALLAHLDAAEGYQCSVPLNASGKEQRSGYPDLRLVHAASQRVFYIDPKVYKQGSEGSSFRTFYFEPKRSTNKILDDASHLIVGVSHSGKQDGFWQLDTWKVVDLIDFKVRLKAEFQANNRQLYQENRVLGESAE